MGTTTCRNDQHHRYCREQGTSRSRSQCQDELELALIDLYCITGHKGYGPLTAEQQAHADLYEQHLREQELEHEAYVAAGGRSVCDECGHRAVKSTTVCTLGYPGHPGADYSALTECGNCGHRDLG